jgi:signal peptidase II
MTGAMGSRFATSVLLAAVLIGIIGCDRVTKRMATETLAGGPDRSFLAGTVRMAYAENTGGFLSLGSDLSPGRRTVVFVVATGLTLIAIPVVAVRARWSSGAVLGATLFVAGGASNWLDRALDGKVVDFLNVGIGPLRTGIFNVADVAIMIGLALLLAAESGRRIQ